VSGRFGSRWRRRASVARMAAAGDNAVADWLVRYPWIKSLIANHSLGRRKELPLFPGVDWFEGPWESES
jgi:hypothetical protein